MIITGIEKDPDLALIKAKMLGSLLYFIEVFFKLRTGREFVISQPVGRESHHITICRELTNIFNLQESRLLINVAPGHGKSTFLVYFVAWAFAHYPDCQFLYISYSHDLAAKHTASIKEIMQMAQYKKFFGIEISRDSSAKDDFKTTSGGAVKAFGSSGGITGQDAGLPNLNRFSGAVLLDDMHKPLEVFSDTIREGVIVNYNNTIKPRPRGPNVPIVGIGQMLHEADLFAYLRKNSDGQSWKKVILKSIDDSGNILCPSITPREMLIREQKYNPYVFSAQYQQEPQPSGGGIFKPEWFELLVEEPESFVTFITVDTAETDKNYNDATVFSFWGVYKIKNLGIETGSYGLHWIDCSVLHVEPADLEPEFRSFYSECMLYKCKPSFVAIEKKSTGTTLISTLKKFRGLEVREVDRTKSSGSKISRYLEAQPYVAKRLISFNKYAKHLNICIEQCAKVTANNTHRHDDIVDTMYDAIKIGLINQSLHKQYIKDKKPSAASEIAEHFKNVNRLRSDAWQ